ncbi:hypothetical protein L873DRAFT_78751 [Choiromyces venosus 120613-1]|uniref:Uncharacterized protein n=1 Tax=Choiromyces venosus 120613-1 TaxID=1336337 RepID=A0A3N4J4Y5_9PEZI|nr:hypothetical protein L873DRAFT_78751 [Choiromyces venosus 120613-1]
MPSNLHACAASWLLKMITRALAHGLIPQVWDDTMMIMTAPEFNNFINEFAGSFKEADLTFLPCVGPERAQIAEYPSVVLESGWSESASRLQDDAKLWQEGSGRAVRVVLQVKFYRPNQ